MDLLVQDILDILEQIAPSALAESWDNVGLLVGNPDATVDSVLISLDPLASLMDEALHVGANLIITHHPPIFKPLSSLRTDQPGGAFLAKAMCHTINVIGWHTNLDAAEEGVSAVLASQLGLTRIRPLLPEQSGKWPGCGLGRIGSCTPVWSPDECIARLQAACSPPWLLEAGARPDTVETVALCAGSGSDFAETALQAGADLYISAEIKHSVARWAEEAGLWIMDCGHFASEQVIVEPLRNMLENELRGQQHDVRVHTVAQRPPLRLVN
jgi:dinuclear metal center YbgI/SA1388 family protein